MKSILTITLGAILAALGAQFSVAQDQPEMSFFVTSEGPGDGANLGGLEGADAHCQQLAEAAGSNKTWRAYLSQSADFRRGDPEIHARDRIGSGPWYNANGQMIAASVTDLHGDLHRDSNNIRKPSAVDENGNPINGAGDTPNQHDILTGSDTRGYALRGAFSTNLTCTNWTSNGEGSTMVGHHDRLGGPNTSWNAVHLSLGCSQENLVATGGAGLFYCFAID
jgi:hypothetical protein